MQLRTKIFFLIGGLFVIVTVIFSIIRYTQVVQTGAKAERQIKEEIILNDQKRREDILAYLSISVAEIESRINILFSKIQEYDWLKTKYAPSDYNYETNDWSSASVLMVANQWIDMVQTVARGKLTSSIITRPPYLDDFIRVALDDFLSIIFLRTKEGIEAYVGVPYWSNAGTNDLDLGIHGMIFQNKVDHDQWLLFTIDQILTVKKEDLKVQNFEIPAGPLEPTVSLKGTEVFNKVVALTIDMILLTQKKIKAYPEWVSRLKSPKEIARWADENIPKALPRQTVSIPNCKSFLCKEFEETTQKQYLEAIRSWAFRYDQNELVWELSTITASGLWDFNPLSVGAPKGIVSFQRRELAGVKGSEPYLGMGFLSKETFSNTQIPILANCSKEDKVRKDNTCISDRLQVISFPNSKAVFLANTLLFNDYQENGEKPSSGSLTLGVNIDSVLQKLALASQSNVLFVDSSGKALVFTEKGITLSKDLDWEGVDFNAMIAQKEGAIKNIRGHEYLFVHITSFAKESGHVFMIQLPENAFESVKRLNYQTRKLIHQLTMETIGVAIVSILVALIILNHILKKVVTPIQKLAIATKAIGMGNLTGVEIPEEGEKRTDEIGLLCRSFKQMVEELKMGVKVRDILNKVVSKEIAQKIISEGVELGGETREVTVLFSDIRNFTQIAEKMDPHQVLDLLNECLTLLSRVIDEHAGVIDKYVGDEIMALFGAPVETKNPALEAVQCAQEMREVLQGWNRQRRRRGLCELEIGIGIHTGSVISGNIGAENHLNYTVLGHNVNVASRVCDHAKEMEILITAPTLNGPGVRENIKFEDLEPVMLKGISTPVQMYRVL